ncbi:MAG: hypothetical protein ACRCX2_13645 [Paraclostridium sp.]
MAKKVLREREFIKIKEVEVFGLERSIKASGLPMLGDFDGEFERTDNDYTIVIGNRDMSRAKHLGSCDTGEGHDNFLSGIVVQFNIEYPMYWTPQFQRYSFQKIVSSMSTMHRITKMNLDSILDPYASKRTKNYIKRLVTLYNEALVNYGNDGIFTIVKDNLDEVVEVISKTANEPTNPNYTYEDGNVSTLYHYIIVNLPQGQNKWMSVTTNYLQLKTMYQQRRGHKLDAWQEFCDWIESLPKFKDLCLK